MKKNILIFIVSFLVIIGFVYFITAAVNSPQEASISTTEESLGSESVGSEPIEQESTKEESVNLEPVDDFIQCLADAGVVIYGSSTCPACSRLEQEYGGYEVIKPIYLDCSGRGSVEEGERCRTEMKTRYVPEIQIKGDLLEGWGSPEALAEATGCKL